VFRFLLIVLFFFYTSLHAQSQSGDYLSQENISLEPGPNTVGSISNTVSIRNTIDAPGAASIEIQQTQFAEAVFSGVNNQNIGFTASSIGQVVDDQPIGSCIADTVEVVFAVDTSPSMNDEIGALCEKLESVEDNLANSGINVTTHLYSITGNGGQCLTSSVTKELGSSVPGDDGECGGSIGTGTSASESWGQATALVANNFSWQSGATRIVVPISDEGPCNGGGASQADDDALQNAIQKAADNNVVVSPIAGTGSSDDLLDKMRNIATESGGLFSVSVDPELDIASSVSQLISSSPALVTDPIQIDISGTRLLGRTGTTNSTPEVLVTSLIPEGEYRIRLHYEDEFHPDQTDQLNEQWYVQLSDELGNSILETSETMDLPTSEIRSFTDIGSHYIGADVYSLRGIHAFVSDEYNSIHPTMVEFYPSCSPRDSTPPVITLIGENPLNIFVNDTFSDPGATALDDIDGDITESIVVGGSIVDTADTGSFVVTYDVLDSSGNSAAQVTRSVVVKDSLPGEVVIQNPPTIISESVVQAQVGISYSYSVVAEDLDEGDVLAFSLTDAPEGMSIDSISGVISWVPTNNQLSMHDVTVKVTDSLGLTDEQSYQILVTEDENPLLVGCSAVASPVAFAGSNAIDLNTWGSEFYSGEGVWNNVDPQWNIAADNLSVTQTVNSFSSIFFSSSQALNSVFEGSITKVGGDDDYIGFVIGFRPNDTNNAQAEYLLVDWKQRTQSFGGVVANAGLAVSRVVGIPHLSELWGHSSLDVEGSDPSGMVEELARGNTLGDVGYVTRQKYDFRFEFGTCNSRQVLLVYVDNNLELEIEGVFPDGRYGFYNNSQGNVIYEGFSILSPGENTAPLVSVVASPLGVVSSPIEFTAEITDDELPIGAVLETKWTQLEGPGIAEIADDVSEITQITFPTPGVYTIQSVVSDGELLGVDTFDITIFADGGNNPPVISSSPVLSAFESVEYRYAVLASDPDPQAVLSFLLLDSPSGMSIDAVTGVVTWIPDVSQLGGNTVVVSVSDGDLAVTQEFEIDVAVPGANVSPVIASTPALNAVESVTYEYQVVASDQDVGDVLAFSLQQSPIGMQIDSVSGLVTWTPDLTQTGSIDVVVSVTDGSVEVTQSFTIEVSTAGVATAAVICQIDSPAQGSEITSLTPLLGSLSAATLGADAGEPLNWSISLSTPEDPVGRVLKSGLGSIPDGSLTNLDPTLLQNNRYRVSISYEQGNQSDSCSRDIRIAGDLKIGNFRLDLVDLNVPVAGTPIAITRTYDTQDLSNGEFGQGWRIGYPGSIRETDATGNFAPGVTKIYVTKPNGSVSAFTFNVVGEGGFFGAIVQRAVFTPDPGTYDTLEVDGDNLLTALNIFNPDRYRLTEPNGTVFVIDQLEGLQSIEDPAGNITTFGVNGISHSSGTQIIFQRDPEGRIQQITDPEGNSILYAYDSDGDLTSVTDRNGDTTSYTYLDEPEHFLTTVTDSQNTVILRAEFDTDGRLLSSSDALDNAVSQNFDPTTNTLITTDAKGNITRFVVDSFGNILTETDPEGGITTYQYNDPRHPTRETSITDANGNTTTNSYDENGNIASTTNPQGKTSLFSFNANDELERFEDSLGAVTQYTYTNGLITTITNPLGDTFSISYNTDGTAQSITDFEGNSTTFEYDGACGCGQPTKVINPDGTERNLTYDTNGQLLVIQDELGHQRIFEYFEDGLLKSETDEQGNTTSYTYENGLRITETDPLGNIREFSYFDNGLLNTEVSPMGATVTRTYDANGNLETLTDPVGNVTQFVYDGNDRLIERIDPLGNFETFIYDPVGNRTSHTDRNGRERIFVFDSLSQMVEEQWLDGDGSVFFTYSYTYDMEGRTTSISSVDSRLDFTYDLAGNLTTETDSRGSDMFTLSYDYNKNGLETNVSDNSGWEIETGYDVQSSLSERIWRNTGVEVGRVAYGYNPRGDLRLIERFSAGDTTSKINQTVYDLHDQRRLFGRISHQAIDGTVIDNKEFIRTYNALNQVVTASNDGNSSTYTYDLDGQLTSVINDVLPNESYFYDLNGNRLSSHLHGSNYETGLNNQLLSDGENTYQYDSEGNPVSRDSLMGETSFTFEWDFRNRLTSISGSDGSSLSIGYDANDRQITLGDGTNVLESFQYDGDNRWSQLASDGNRANFLFGEDIDTNLAESGNDGLNWYLASHQNSIVGTVNNNNTVTSSRQYDSFGNNFGDLLSISDFGFTGREYFPATDQYYFRSRLYQPGIGRFVGEDQIGFDGNDANLFRFLTNNPTIGTDPFGEISIVETTLLAGNILSIAGVAQKTVCDNPLSGANEPIPCDALLSELDDSVFILIGNPAAGSLGVIQNKVRSTFIQLIGILRAANAR